MKLGDLVDERDCVGLLAVLGWGWDVFLKAQVTQGVSC